MCDYMELVEDGKNGNNDRHQVMWAVLDFRMQSSKGLTLFSIHGGIVETLTIWYACGQLGILLLSLSWDLFTLKDVGLLIGLSGGRSVNQSVLIVSCEICRAIAET